MCCFLFFDHVRASLLAWKSLRFTENHFATSKYDGKFRVSLTRLESLRVPPAKPKSKS